MQEMKYQTGAIDQIIVILLELQYSSCIIINNVDIAAEYINISAALVTTSTRQCYNYIMHTFK